MIFQSFTSDKVSRSSWAVTQPGFPSYQVDPYSAWQDGKPGVRRDVDTVYY